ncbi:MAG: NAD(P)-dependent oxidoreductase [Pedobacter sp.]|nr:MAG: NAD(P)-dependent oxidoreductase [Pedobacter sp.]
MNEHVLITGASGFLGYHIVNAALKKGVKVFAAVRKNSRLKHLEGLAINYLTLDYEDVEEMSRQLSANNIRYIIHAAGITKANDLAAYSKVNADYTNNLAIAANTAKIDLKKFVFVSSLAAIGPLADLEAEIQDDTPSRPVTSYGASKVLAEKYLNDIPSLPLIIIRPTAVYGPREKDIFILFKSISRGLEPYIGRFKQQLSFIYVKDLAKVVVQALDCNFSGRQYNISDGQVYDRYMLGILIKKAMKKRTFMFHLPIGVVAALAGLMEFLYRNSSASPTLNKEKMAELTAVNWACNVDHAIKDLGFDPKYNLEKGLTETVAWYQGNKWL